MTPTEKKLVIDRLDKLDSIQEDHARKLANHETIIAAATEVVETMEARMTAFEPVLAGIDSKLNELLKEKREKEIADNAVKSTPAAQFMEQLKKRLMETAVLMISGFVVAVVVGLFFLLLKNGAFKGLGWG